MIVFTASDFTLKPLYSLSLPINSNVSIFPISKDKSLDSSSGISEISNVILFAPDEATACAISTFDAVAVILGIFIKAFIPISFISDEILNFSKETHPLNALLPILSILLYFIYSKDEQPSKASSGISVMKSLNLIAFILFLSLNTPGAIPMILTAV